MGLFNFFGEGEHRTFDYKPIYYDKAEEERRRIFGAADGSLNKDNEKYVPGSYIKGSFRDGNYQTLRTNAKKAQTIIGIITMLLLCGILYFIAKFYSLL